MPSAEPMEEKIVDGFVQVDKKNLPPHEECSQTSEQPSKFIEGVRYGKKTAEFFQPGVNAAMNAAAVGAGVVAGLTFNIALYAVWEVPKGCRALITGFRMTQRISFKEGD